MVVVVVVVVVVFVVVVVVVVIIAVVVVVVLVVVVVVTVVVVVFVVIVVVVVVVVVVIVVVVVVVIVVVIVIIVVVVVVVVVVIVLVVVVVVLVVVVVFVVVVIVTNGLPTVYLDIVLIILYLLFTCPRATMICLQGVFVTSSRHSSAAAVTTTDSDVIYAVLESLSELAYSIYQASLLPLLASYHANFFHLLVNSTSFCCRRCCRSCSDRRTAQINDNIPIALTTVTTTQGNVRKSVKFDMQAVEFEI